MSDAARKDAALKITMPGDMAGRKALIEQLACTVDSQHNTIDSQSHAIDELRREKQELKLALVGPPPKVVVASGRTCGRIVA